MRLPSGASIPSTRTILHKPPQEFSTATKPDPVSNIRTVRYRVDPRHSLRRCQLEARRLQATVKWNEFWTKHNTEYNNKLELLKATYANLEEIPSEEMSRFYASHLNETRGNHKAFNAWWIKENFALLFGGIECWFHERLPASERNETGFFDGKSGRGGH